MAGSSRSQQHWILFSRSVPTGWKGQSPKRNSRAQSIEDTSVQLCLKLNGRAAGRDASCLTFSHYVMWVGMEVGKNMVFHVKLIVVFNWVIVQNQQPVLPDCHWVAPLNVSKSEPNCGSDSDSKAAGLQQQRRCYRNAARLPLLRIERPC